MSEKKNVNFNLVKKLVAELEALVTRAESIDTKTEAGNAEYIVEMNKAYGLAAGITQEGTLLAGDIRRLVKTNSAYVGGVPSGNAEEDLLTAFFGPQKNSDDSKN